VTLRHRIRFYQQLALLVRAGVPIRGCLERLKERLSEKELAVVSEKVNAGERLGEAFAAAGFSAFECNLVIAGERSAHLDTVFEHLAEYWKRDLELRQALIRPLIYPLVVLNLAVLLMSLLEFVGSVAEPVIVIHLIMRVVVLYALLFVVYTLVRVSWSSPFMRGFWLRVPIIGGSLRAAYAYRWITALRLEFGAGISLYRAVGDAWRASGYVDGEQFAQEGEQELRQGVDLSKLVLRWQQLPRDWVDFIETGQISGKFEEAFTQLEAEAARAWKLAQDRMTEWVPKICYFFVLLIVAAVVIHLMKAFYVDPMVNAENEIDNTGR
jgi:type IV pilus assembly protein PilC